MSRREIKVFVALLAAFTVVAAAIMIGMSALGAPDELTGGMLVAAFSVAAFACGSLMDESPPDHR